jgi:hypothetical protein
MKYLARTGVVVGAILLLTACRGADDARKPKELLQYIPADTPYVMAFTEPLPDDLLDKIEPALDETLTAYRSLMEMVVEDTAAKMAEEAGREEEAERFEAFMTEAMALMSTEGLKNAGLDRDSLFAFYGDGLLPVIRLALSDGDKFAATVARLEAAAGEELLVAELDDVPYRYWDFEGKARLIIATPGDDAIITVVPTAFDDTRLARTLGVEKPRESLAGSKELGRIAEQYDFTDHWVSFFDMQRIAASFLGDPSGLNTELLDLMNFDASEIDATCRAEFAGLAAIAPRVVLGYTDVNDERIDTRMVVELRDDIAAGLATLPAAVPGLGPDPGGLFSFGFSLDPMALREFYEARLDAMEADPFECEQLAELQASTVKGREVLAQPIPPVVYNFRGIFANVIDVAGFDMAAKMPPESLDATILFAMENAQDVVNMAALMNPQIAALNLLPDGEARMLDLPELGEFAGQAFAALTNSGLAVALGESAEREAEAALQADVSSPQPLMSLSMDAARYYDFVAESVMQAEDSEEEEPMPLEFREAMRDVVVSSSKVYERMLMNVHVTDRGIEIDSRVTLAD